MGEKGEEVMVRWRRGYSKWGREGGRERRERRRGRRIGGETESWRVGEGEEGRKEGRSDLVKMAAELRSVLNPRCLGGVSAVSRRPVTPLIKRTADCGLRTADCGLLLRDSVRSLLSFRGD